MAELKALEPAAIWHFFEEITQIPRPSGHEKQILSYLIEFARQHKLEYKQDATGNLVLRKPATPGMEHAPGVVLQSHVDMVCEKNSDVTFDFDRDPIRAYEQEGWVQARGTTLGADCGIGVAATLAVLDADNLTHGPLEALFTVEEETGLCGAFGLGNGMITGAYLINLDSEDEGELFVGCAGGMNTVSTLHFDRESTPKGYQFMRMDVSGLIGGHAGDDIQKGRANANKILSRFLHRMLLQEIGIRLAYFDGGNLHNAIPREAFAVFGIPAHESKHLIERFTQYKQELREEFGTAEAGMDLSLSDMPLIEKVMEESVQVNLIRALCGVPNGVMSLSRVIPGMVASSTNLASVKFIGDTGIEIVTSQYAALPSAVQEVGEAVAAVFLLAGAEVCFSRHFPGWVPNPESHLAQISRENYRKLFNQEPIVRSVHAGLECGVLLQKHPQMEMISFGPTLRGVHSPEERIEVASVDRFWRLLTAVMASLSA
ncbi:MAG: aminoacyl-histidine dipeptidase [Alistipes sp.]|nr:aminoacyl-histidine dipeptidase [Alistipes sp.]